MSREWENPVLVIVKGVKGLDWMCWQGNDCSGDRKDARNVSKDFMVRHTRITNYLAISEREFVDFHIQLRGFLLFTVVGAASVPGV